MIKKILKIKAVGRFKSFACNNEDLAFNKTTVIFGYNTYGKSTLTSIFRSLKDRNPHYIHGRKTFGISDNQEVEILDVHNNKFVFNSNWENKNIEIFDNDFIAKNVFYGDYINKEQQSSLYGILIGHEVYKLKQNIDELKKEQDKLQKEKTDIENKFTKGIFGPFSSFLVIKVEPEIDERIKESQDKIKQHENLDSLKQLILKTPLCSTFSNFKAEFLKTLDLSVEEIINTHIEKNWKDTTASKDFLNQGLNLLKEDGGCVFCGQDLGGVNGFIINLRKVFSNEYRNLKESINKVGNNFKSIDLEKIFLEFDKCGLNLRNKLNYENLLLIKNNIDTKIEKKQNDLNIKLDFDHDLDFVAFLEELGKLTDILNSITTLVSGDMSQLVILKNTLNNQLLNKYRFSKEGIDIFEEYKKSEKNIDLKKEEIKKLNEYLTEKVNQIFKQNEKQINFFLKELGANFSLKNFVPKSHMGLVNTHFCDFQFIIDDVHAVQVSNKARKDDPEPENKPHFKNTLSDSDRRVLAFAFFIAKLSNDDNLENKIIVLDDPFSSFDENRKEETIKLLTTIKNNNDDEPAQKIILTHDKEFLCRLYDKLPKESKVLKIHYSSTGGSTLNTCNVENEFLKDDYFKNIEYIKNSIDNSTNIDEALKRVRPCLEHLLKRKYYFLLKTETIKKKSVGEYLNEIGSLCLKKDEILSDNWHEDMHDSHQIIKLNDPAKIAKLKRFLELIKEI